MENEILEDTDEAVTLCLGISQWVAPNGRFILEEDFNVDGEVWRVHKYDPDPFPSRPHAHCIGGGRRFVGCKLHLGTAGLYKGATSQNRTLGAKQFGRLIELIRPKFPGLTLPLR